MPGRPTTAPASPSPDQTVGDLGEHALIERIHDRVPQPPNSVVHGIGDDAAVLEPDRGTLSVLTTDALVEDVHFDLAYTPMDAIGHKALAVSLSDLASMGALPRHALLSLALPKTLLVRDLEGLIDGFLSLAARHRTSLVGGNITQSRGALFIDVTAVGSVKRRRVLTRTGAHPGDDLYVSGDVGSAAAGLSCLTSALVPLPSDALDYCRERFLRPEPRVRLGTQLGRTKAARACVDLSDGLADAIRQLAAPDGLGAMIDAALIPLAPGARHWFESQGMDPVAAGLVGGEDYELLFAVPTAMRRQLAAVRRLTGTLAVTRIGQVTLDSALVLLRDGHEEALPSGYEHFRR